MAINNGPNNLQLTATRPDGVTFNSTTSVIVGDPNALYINFVGTDVSNTANAITLESIVNIIFNSVAITESVNTLDFLIESPSTINFNSSPILHTANPQVLTSEGTVTISFANVDETTAAGTFVIATSAGDVELSFITITQNEIANPLTLTSEGSSNFSFGSSNETIIANTVTFTNNNGSFTGSLSDNDIQRIVDAIFSRIIEGSETFSDQLKLIRAISAGNISQVGDQVYVKSANGTTNRITATIVGTEREITNTNTL